MRTSGCPARALRSAYGVACSAQGAGREPFASVCVLPCPSVCNNKSLGGLGRWRATNLHFGRPRRHLLLPCLPFSSCSVSLSVGPELGTNRDLFRMTRLLMYLPPKYAELRSDLHARAYARNERRGADSERAQRQSMAASSPVKLSWSFGGHSDSTDAKNN